MNEYTKRLECAGCGNDSLETILDLGSVPFVGEFPSYEDLDNQTRWDLNLLFCDNCKLVQTDSLIEPKVAFKDYRYLSSVSLSEYFKQVAFDLNEDYNIKDKKINFSIMKILIQIILSVDMILF